MNKKMARNVFFLSVVMFCGMLTGLSPLAADSERELREAVSSLNSWLGNDGHKSRQWRQILALNILDTQSALGHRADSSALADVRRRFDMPIGELNHPVFNRVRRCIDQHLFQLSQTHSDVRFSAEQARHQYQPATMEGINTLREDAIFGLKMLKRYYKYHLTSRPRAELYYELKPDETIAFLESVDFEIAPVRTKDVISQEIAETESLIQAIEEQTKKLNEQREQIQKWLDDLKENQNQQGIDPPGPDDTNTNLTATNGEFSSPKMELEANDQGQKLLLGQIEDLQQKLADLREELDNYDNMERERLGRFRDILNQYNDYLDPYTEQRLLQNSAFYAQAYAALDRLKTAYLAAANPNTENQFNDRLDKFPEYYEQLTAQNDRRAAAEIGNLTGWLEGAGQVPDLVAAVRTKHSLPNLYLEVSDYLVNELAGRDVNEVRRVNEQILGRLIRGHAYVNGKVSVQFIADSNQARAAIDLTGSIESHTFSRQGKITGYAGANAQYNIRRDLYANIGGLFACDPYGDLQLKSYFKGVDSSYGFIQRIANKQYWKTKFLSEAISRDRTKAQMFPQFEQETSEALEQGFDRFTEINAMRTDSSQLLPALYMFTTSDRLVAVGHRATRYDLAANNPPKCFDNIPADLYAKLHESMLSNYASPLLAGRRLTNTEIADQFSELLDRDVGARENDEDREDFSIKFAQARPIQFEFEDNQLAVTIIGDEFTREKNRIRNGLRIRLAFRLERDAEILRLVPASDVSVELVDPKQTNIATVSFKNFLQDRLTDVLNETRESAIEIPSNLIPTENIEGEIAADVARQLQLVQLRTEDGWFYAGWKYLPDHTLFHGVTDTPAIWYPLVETAPTINAVDVPDELDSDLRDQLDELKADADSN